VIVLYTCFAQLLSIQGRVRFVAKTTRGKINPGSLGDFPPAGSRGGAPAEGLGDEVPQKPKDSKKNTSKMLMF